MLVRFFLARAPASAYYAFLQMSNSTFPRLPDSQAEVMEIIWREGAATVRDVFDSLNESSSHKRAYTTVMTTMRRLHDRGLLERQRHGKADIYRPSMTREDFMAGRALKEVAELVDEFGDVALQHFAAEMEKLEPSRRDALRQLARKHA